MDQSLRQLIVYSREECGLCDELLAQLEPLAESLGARISVRDVDECAEWQRRFGLKVPVVTDSDGNVICWGQYDEGAIRAAVDSS